MMASAFVEGYVTWEGWAMTIYMANLADPRHKHKPATFHRFSKLPQELQNNIWGFVVMNLANDFRNETRIIIEMRGDPISKRLCFTAPYQAPAILQVSSGARAEGLRLLPSPNESGVDSGIRHHHFNFTRDIFFVTYSTHLDVLDADLLCTGASLKMRK